ELSRCAAIPVALLVVDRAEHVDGRVSALAIVDGFEPVHRRRPRAGACRPRLGLDQLELVGSEERLGQRVVPAYPRLPHRLLRPVRVAERAELGRRVLGGFNWSSQRLDYEELRW